VKDSSRLSPLPLPKGRGVITWEDRENWEEIDSIAKSRLMTFFIVVVSFD
jgi:hypothetical protein